MRLFRGIESLQNIDSSVVAVGSFDGVHAAHRALLSELVDRANFLNAESFVVTFEPHARIAMGKADGMGLLTTLEERLQLIDSYGVANLLLLPFNQELQSMTTDDFVHKILIGQLKCRELVMGYNHHLGRDRMGAEEIQQMDGGCSVRIVNRVEVAGVAVSSTKVRNLIKEGQMTRAVELLSHPYLISGEVHGGVLAYGEKHKLIPPDGLYKAHVAGAECIIEIENGKIHLPNAVDGLASVNIISQIE